MGDKLKLEMDRRNLMPTNIFRDEQFACPCCGENKIHPLVVELLNQAAGLMEANGFCLEYEVTSGYRCPKHNKEVGGAERSFHLRGLAADTRPVSNDSHILRYWTFALIRAGFTGLGQTYPGKTGQIAIHADLRHLEGRPPQIWAPPQNMKMYGRYLYVFPW